VPSGQLVFADKLVICSDIPYPPQEFFDANANPIGSDIEIGQEWRSAGRTVTAADIVNFASKIYETHLLTVEDPHTIRCPAAGVTFIMGVPGADDVMLNYQSTSFHDALYVRDLFGLKRAPEFDDWLFRTGLAGADFRLTAGEGLLPDFASRLIA